MIAFIRWISRFIHKEEVLFEQYNKEHPHFRWYLGIDAAITSVVVFFVSAFIWNAIPSQQVDTNILLNAGVQKMLSGQIPSEIRDNQFVGYWIGQGTGNSYEHNDFANRKIVITYFSSATPNSNTPNSDVPIMTVTTYQDSSAYHRTLHPIANGIVISQRFSGGIVKFASVDPMEETITPKGKSYIVTISYPQPQTRQVLMKNAAELRQVGS